MKHRPTTNAGGAPADASPTPDGAHTAPANSLADLAAADPDWQNRLARAAAGRDSLGQLTLGMAHELNNLVGGISALSEIYLQTTESGLPIKEGVGLIHNSAGRLQKLLRQLTEINRRSGGERAYLNLSEMVPAEMELFARVLPRGVRIDVLPAGAEMAVLLDETALRQVLLHLVLNLRDALGSERADGTLKVRLTRLPGEIPGAELSMSAHSAQGENEALRIDGDDPHWLDAQVRLYAARRSVEELGAKFEARNDGEFIITFSLLA